MSFMFFKSVLVKSVLVLISAGFLLLSARPCAADVPEVRSVDLYPKGARFVFELPPVEGAFQFELPGAFDPQTVRPLNPRGITGLKVITKNRKDWVPPSLASLKEQADAQARTVARLKAKTASLQQTRALLQSGIEPLKEAEGKNLIRYIEDAQALRLRVEDDLVELEDTLRKEQKELERLEEELDSRMPQGASQIIQVSGRSNVREPLCFEARTDAARWGLRYVMDLNSTTGAIDVRMFASAAQGTGIDYSGDLTFYSRPPADSVSPPDLKPLRVALEKKRKDDFRSASGRTATALSVPMMQAAEPQNYDLELPSIESTLSNVTIRGRGTLEGDGSPSDVALGGLSFESTPLLVLIPEQRAEGWIVASMDTIPVPLLPGTAELLVDGQPSGRTYVPEYGLGQTRLPFGSASRLSAKKTPIVESTGSSWFGGSGIFNGGYTLEVSSGLETEREVVVRDRLPIPVDDKIKLEVKKIEPEPTERDRANCLTWKLPLKPGETRKIVVEYTLTYPSSETLEYR